MEEVEDYDFNYEGEDKALRISLPAEVEQMLQEASEENVKYVADVNSWLFRMLFFKNSIVGFVLRSESRRLDYSLWHQVIKSMPSKFLIAHLNLCVCVSLLMLDVYDMYVSENPFAFTVRYLDPFSFPAKDITRWLSEENAFVQQCQILLQGFDNETHVS